MRTTYVEMSMFEAAVSPDPDYAERRFWELAGPCAVPRARDGQIWERHDERDTFIAVCDIPSPEGLLL